MSFIWNIQRNCLNRKETESGRLRYVHHRSYLSMTLSESCISGNGGLPINEKLFSFKLLWILSCFEVRSELWKCHGVRVYRSTWNNIWVMIQFCFRMLFVCVFAKLASCTWEEQEEVVRQASCVMKYFK